MSDDDWGSLIIPESDTLIKSKEKPKEKAKEKEEPKKPIEEESEKPIRKKTTKKEESSNIDTKKTKTIEIISGINKQELFEILDTNNKKLLTQVEKIQKESQPIIARDLPESPINQQIIADLKESVSIISDQLSALSSNVDKMLNPSKTDTLKAITLSYIRNYFELDPKNRIDKYTWRLKRANEINDLKTFELRILTTDYYKHFDELVKEGYLYLVKGKGRYIITKKAFIDNKALIIDELPNIQSRLSSDIIKKNGFPDFDELLNSLWDNKGNLVMDNISSNQKKD